MKNNTNAGAQNKVSAQEMMDLVVGIDQKVSTLVGRDTREGGNNNNPYLKAGVAIAVLLMIAGIAILAFMFVPQLVGLIPALAGQWQWVCLGYAAITVIVVSLFNLKIPIRILSVLFAIAPIAANLIASAL